MYRSEQQKMIEPLSIINSLDSAAFICIVSSLLLIARKKRMGWWIGCLGQVLWISWSFGNFDDRFWIMIQSIILLVLNAYGGWNWKKD
jgi:hypothetical protein